MKTLVPGICLYFSESFLYIAIKRVRDPQSGVVATLATLLPLPEFRIGMVLTGTMHSCLCFDECCMAFVSVDARVATLANRNTLTLQQLCTHTSNTLKHEWVVCVWVSYLPNFHCQYAHHCNLRSQRYPQLLAFPRSLYSWVCN